MDLYLVSSLIYWCNIFSYDHSRKPHSTLLKVHLSKVRSVQGRLKLPTMRILLTALTAFVEEFRNKEFSS